MNLPKVLHVVESGDTSGLFRGFARHHDRERWAVSFVTLEDPEPGFAADLEELGVTVSGLGVRGRADLPGAAVRLAARLRRQRPAVVHAHLFRPSLVAMVSAVVARVPARIVTRHHSDYHTRTGRWLPVALDRLITFLAHRVVSVSDHVRHSMEEEEGLEPEKVVTIPNGVDAGRFQKPRPERAAELRGKLAESGEQVILVPARLHPEKGHVHLFRALELLASSGVDCRLWVAGEGPFETDYREEVAALGLEDRIDFLGFRPDVADLMAAADVVAVPSVAEAFGLVALEARVMSRPVVASRVGAIPELLEEGRAGLLVPPGDPAELARALRRILTEPELADALEAAGGRHLLEDWSLETMVRRYEGVYIDLSGPPAHD